MPWAEQVEAVFWGLGVGAAIVVVIWASIKGGWWRMGTIPGNEEFPVPFEPIHEYSDDFLEAHGPVPLIVKLVTVSFLLWAVGYVVVFVTSGFTFS